MSRTINKVAEKVVAMFVSATVSARSAIGVTATDGRNEAPLIGACLTDTVIAISKRSKAATVLTEALRDLLDEPGLSNAQARDVLIARNGDFCIPVFAHSNVAAAYKIYPGDVPDDMPESEPEVTARELLKQRLRESLSN